MPVSIDDFIELYRLGLCPIPVIWDIEKKTVTKHPDHQSDISNGRPTYEDVSRWIEGGMANYNGIALKLYPPFACFDVDLKNTQDKGIFDDWMNIIDATDDACLRKVVIEKTRNGGYHVYFKYSKIEHKVPVARGKEGEEIIAVYTGGLLSYCCPSPNYEIIKGDWEDLEELTDDEYDLMLSAAATFNEYEELQPGESAVAIKDYPFEYENTCLQFDELCTDDLFNDMLNTIDLFKCKLPGRQSKKFVPYLRKGSSAAYSAKAYFNRNKRLLLFTSSLKGFPCFQDSAKAGDKSWSLSPAKIVFYSKGKDWPETIAVIKQLCEKYKLDLVEQKPIDQMVLIKEDRLNFPFDIFPDAITNYLNHQTFQHEYIAGSILAAISVCIGNRISLQAMDGYVVKPILYMAIVAPPGSSKSPALKTAFSVIEKHDNIVYESYARLRDEYKLKLAEAKKDKDKEEPIKPVLSQMLIKDSTIEMVIGILARNAAGCCIFADELSGFLKRMNQYKSGDDVQKWLELWSGSSIMVQRVGRDEDKADDPFCSIIGGIQPGVLESLSSDDNEHNGFYHRFLFVYPKPQLKPDWLPVTIPRAIKDDFERVFNTLIARRGQHAHQLTYALTPEANDAYAQWFNRKNAQYNKATSDHVKGIIAKYQDYCLRFALIIHVMNDLSDLPSSNVPVQAMERAIRLTEYFFGNMHKATKILTPETPVDRFSEIERDFYRSLPDSFTLKTAIETGVKLGLKDGTVKTFVYRKGKELFTKCAENGIKKLF